MFDEAELLGAGIVVVLDTNVIIDMTSSVDFDKATPAQKGYRRSRAREATLLSLYLHELGATTFSLHEAIRKQKVVVPNTTFTRAHVMVVLWVNVLFERMLPNWRMTLPKDGEGEPEKSEADSCLVDIARKLQVPLITHEGLSQSGVDESKPIRKKAREAGVRVMTAREFYGNWNESKAAERFFREFQSTMASWARTEPPEWQDLIASVTAYYREILFGVPEA